MRLFNLWFVVCFLSLSIGRGGEVSEEVARWIEQLGADTHAEREEASRALWDIGDPALAALRIAGKRSDPEIRHRASELLKWIESGARPAWPRDLLQDIQALEEMDKSARASVYERVAELGAREDFRFSLSRLEFADGDVAEKRLVSLMETPAFYEEVLGRLAEPRNEREARVLAAAALAEGQVESVALALRSDKLMGSDRSQLSRAGLDILKELYKTDKHEAMRESAALLAVSEPDDSRFRLLEAVALGRRGQADAANTMIHLIFQKHAEQEDVLFRNGSLAQELGQMSLAMAHWRRILKTPPEGSLYDVNAYMRMGQFYEKKDEYVRASLSFKRGLKTLRTLKQERGGVAMVGASEEELEERIARLMRQAESREVKRSLVRLEVYPEIVNGGEKDLKEILKDAEIILSLRIKPYGVRVLEKAPVDVVYNDDEGAYELRLNGTQVLDRMEAKPPRDGARVLLRSLDRIYEYVLDAHTSKAERVRTFDVDYTLKIFPSDGLKEWTDTSITLDEKEHTWEELAQGLSLDMMPEKLKVDVSGKNSEGIQGTLKMEFDTSSMGHE